MIIEIVMSIFFNRRVSLQVDPIISISARSITSSSQRCCLHPFQVDFVFPPSHPCFLQGFRFLNQVSILLMLSLSILFRQYSYSLILRKILTELQVHHSSFLLSSPVDSNQAFGVDRILFLVSNVFSCRCTS